MMTCEWEKRMTAGAGTPLKPRERGDSIESPCGIKRDSSEPRER